jgi:hypothetical protein
MTEWRRRRWLERIRSLTSRPRESVWMYPRRNARAVWRWEYNPGDVFKNIPRFIIPSQLFIHPRSVICGPLRPSSRSRRAITLKGRDSSHSAAIPVDDPRALPGYSLRGPEVKTIPSFFTEPSLSPPSETYRNPPQAPGSSDLLSAAGLARLRGMTRYRSDLAELVRTLSNLARPYQRSVNLRVSPPGCHRILRWQFLLA